MSTTHDPTGPSPLPADNPTGELRATFTTKRGRVFVVRVPNESIVGKALTLAAVHHKDGYMREQLAAQGAQLRLCLVSVDGRPVRFDELQDDGLFKFIDIKEYSMLIKAMEKLTTPPAEDVEDFLSSMTLS